MFDIVTVPVVFSIAGPSSTVFETDGPSTVVFSTDVPSTDALIDAPTTEFSIDGPAQIVVDIDEPSIDVSITAPIVEFAEASLADSGRDATAFWAGASAIVHDLVPRNAPEVLFWNAGT